jgi:hypothetical protein
MIISTLLIIRMNKELIMVGIIILAFALDKPIRKQTKYMINGERDSTGPPCLLGYLSCTSRAH